MRSILKLFVNLTRTANAVKVPLVFIALVAVIGLSRIACDDLFRDKDKDGGGTFTVTGIPSAYNGKYAMFNAYITVPIYGFQNINRTPVLIVTLVKISNRSVSLPTWTINDNDQAVRYSGNDTVDGYLAIYNSATAIDSSLAIVERSWDSITFLNGSATETWINGYSK